MKRSYRDMREYHRIRKIIELIYVYGFVRRDEIEEFGINKNTYDKELRRIKEIYEDLLISGAKSGRKPGFQRDYFFLTENFLADTFRLKSYTDKELITILYTLVLLSLVGKGTVTEIKQYIERHVNVEDGQEIYFTVRRTLRDLSNIGVLRTDHRQYFLPKTIFSSLTKEELTALYRYVCFAKKVSYPKIAGYFLKDTMALFCSSVGIKQKDDIFLIRHTNNRSILDEELVYLVLKAIKSRLKIRVRFYDKKDKKDGIVAPVYLKMDRKMGRWFLFASAEQKPVILRLNDVKKIEMTNQIFDYEKETLIIGSLFEHTMISSAGIGETPYVVRAKLYFEANEQMKKQFLREMLIGKILEKEGGLEYEATIQDPLEIYPFLRSWSKYIEILPGKDGLRERLIAEVQEMMAIYEHL